MVLGTIPLLKMDFIGVYTNFNKPYVPARFSQAQRFHWVTRNLLPGAHLVINDSILWPVISSFTLCSWRRLFQNKAKQKPAWWTLRQSSYLSWSPMGFILKWEGQTEVEVAVLISGVHWPWGSTTTFSTFGACSGWTMLWAVLASDCAGCNAMGDRWISWFFSLSCLKESWNLSFNL